MTDEALLRTLAPQVLGAVVRRYGDFPAAEEAVQEALLAAALQWPAQGRPDQPRAWLVRVAGRRMTDQIRADVARRRREADALPEPVVPAPDVAPPEGDDTLLLLFMCCHPALTRPSAIALTLRAVGGLTTAEIARAFLVPEATMAQRISRAKQKIRESGVAFALPSPAEHAARLGAVLQVLYLVFSEGYASSGPSLQRADLAREALRLARMLHAQLPDVPEATGLLALMLLTDARREARTGPDGQLVPLDAQDRGRWDRAAIAEGVALVHDALPRGAVGPYQLQAAIAALHDEAPSTEETDWPQILALYTVLLRLTQSPVVALNHAVAVAMVHGPRAGLARLAALRGEPRLLHRVAAVRAHLLERDGDVAGAVAAYREAAAGTTSAPERDYLLLRAARLR
ncbi:MAG: DUF6596 domain-containing protein [Myxococcota bacterium]